jgi:hypothetical protein
LFKLFYSETKNCETLKINKKVYWVDIDVQTQNLVTEIVPDLFVHISNLMNPFEYFYESTSDSDMPIFKDFITHQSSVIYEPAFVQIPRKSDINLILKCLSVSIPYISCLISLIHTKNSYFYDFYSNHISKYMNENHFQGEIDKITQAKSSYQNYSYAYDNLKKKILYFHKYKAGKELSKNYETKIRNLEQYGIDFYAKNSIFLEIMDIKMLFGKNCKDFDIDLDTVKLSIIDLITKIPIINTQDITISNQLKEKDEPKIPPKEEEKTNLLTNNPLLIVEEEPENSGDNIDLEELEKINIKFEKKRSVDTK